MGLSNGLCSNHVGWSQSSRTHSSGAAAQIERPEVRTIACGHRVHDRVLGAGFVAVVPRPIRFGRIFLMDLSNRAVRPQASAVGRKSIARIGDRRTGRTLRRPRRGMAGGMGRRARSARRPQVEGRTQGDSLMHRGFCTDCGAYAALGENDRCAACDAWRHREEERRDHV